MFRFSSRIQKQRVIPVFRGGKKTCIEACARPRKDRNLSLEAAREEQPVSDVFFKMGNGHSLQRDKSGFRSFSRYTVPFFDEDQRPRKNRNDAA